jgi:hypothetical protein
MFFECHNKMHSNLSEFFYHQNFYIIKFLCLGPLQKLIDFDVVIVQVQKSCTKTKTQN